MLFVPPFLFVILSMGQLVLDTAGGSFKATQSEKASGSLTTSWDGLSPTSTWWYFQPQ